jgi:hypothetical protein
MSASPLTQIRIELTGNMPLVMHNEQLANPRNVWARDLKALSSKRTKTDADLEEMARIEVAGGLYADWGEPTGDLWTRRFDAYVPGLAVRATIKAGATIRKNGKNVERALLDLDHQHCTFDYDGPDTVKGLFEDGYVLERLVRVGQSRVMRSRPQFPKWNVTAHANLDTSVLNLAALEQSIEDAGRLVGLLEARTIGYGRFTGTVEII